ncbi:MAG: HlyD family efflux transporter periplasmic adaptor subunit [Bacteroidales bacterium]|nr:HlyD family efflux transporter periplasmic adaptor subunit [Bacteroidales bacterium]
MKKRNVWIISIVVVSLLAVYYIFGASRKEKKVVLETQVKQGPFEILVTVTGELQAARSQNITGPVELRSRNLRLNNIRIQDLVPEGTVVKEGDYVATLDRSEADNQLKDIMDEVEKAESNFNKTRLDTTILLRNLRDELINLRFSMEEARIKLEQSKYEPPATIRQAQIDLEKAERNYEQARKNYFLKEQQAKEDMSLSAVELARARRRMQEMQSVLEKFIIRAPADGMVIYAREWSGEKRKVGSTISPWDLTVATLPDLTSMISKTYVNEIDISKVKPGQPVRITVDAFPEKKYTGVVIEVANIGEQLPNTDAKVFEVIIKVNEFDPILRPSMTTGNAIRIARLENVLFVPLEAIFSDDSIPYVFRKNGTKQIVVLGETNENEVIVEQGLKAGDRILLSKPDNAAKMKTEGTELIPVILQKAREKKEREEALRKSEVESTYRQMPDTTRKPSVTGKDRRQRMRARP